MKKTIILGLMLILATTIVSGFPDDDITYFVFEARNSSDDSFYDGSHTVNEQIFYAATGGSYIKDQTATYMLNNGTWMGLINDSGISYSAEFWIQINVSGDVLTPRIRYVPTIQAQTALNVTDINFYNINITGKLGLDNLSACGANEIPKYTGGSWSCETDNTGSNNYATAVSVTGTSTKNITITRQGLASISDTYTDLVNSTQDMINTINHSEVSVNCNYINFSGTIGSAGICDGSDASGGGGSGAWDTSNDNYLYNDTSYIYYNTTHAENNLVARNISGILTDAQVSNDLTCSIWDGETSQANLNVNSSNYWDGLNTPADINAADIIDDDTYATTASAETFDENVVFAKNITVELLNFENDIPTHRIYDNTTCIIIEGDTSTLSIC